MAPSPFQGEGWGEGVSIREPLGATSAVLHPAGECQPSNAQRQLSVVQGAGHQGGPATAGRNSTKSASPRTPPPAISSSSGNRRCSCRHSGPVPAPVLLPTRARSSTIVRRIPDRTATATMSSAASEPQPGPAIGTPAQIEAEQDPIRLDCRGHFRERRRIGKRLQTHDHARHGRELRGEVPQRRGPPGSAAAGIDPELAARIGQLPVDRPGGLVAGDGVEIGHVELRQSACGKRPGDGLGARVGDERAFDRSILAPPAPLPAHDQARHQVDRRDEREREGVWCSGAESDMLIDAWSEESGTR